MDKITFYRINYNSVQAQIFSLPHNASSGTDEKKSIAGGNDQPLITGVKVSKIWVKLECYCLLSSVVNHMDSNPEADDDKLSPDNHVFKSIAIFIAVDIDTYKRRSVILD